jgi:hypothetical protein
MAKPFKWSNISQAGMGTNLGMMILISQVIQHNLGDYRSTDTMTMPISAYSVSRNQYGTIWQVQFYSVDF